MRRGVTVRLAHLSQDTAEIPGHLRVLESLERVRLRTTLSDGTELTAAMLCDRFGFRGARGRTLVRDLSGGERRRLQLMRLLMEEPNVLLLDEPTNDLDVDTLTALEDLLDAWPGTLVVVSHDRYFVERVCDDVYALMGDGGIRHLPGGIDQYIVPARRDGRARTAATAARPGPALGRGEARGAQGGAAPGARAGAALRPGGGPSRTDGRPRDRPRAPARPDRPARGADGRAGAGRDRLAGGIRDGGGLSG